MKSDSIDTDLKACWALPKFEGVSEARVESPIKSQDHKVNLIFKLSNNIPSFLLSTKAKQKMAGGAFVSEGGSGGRDYEGGVTVFVVITCMVAAMGGLLFGYDLGISGGVTSMDEFLSKFFPQLEKQRVKAKHETAYCKFDDQKLQLFTSSLYLAALVASFVASVVTRKYGRKVSMLILNNNCFSFQSTPVYLSEMAPAKIRGALNICFQVAITSGILVANLINYGTSNMAKNGWRVSLGLAAVPAILMVIGSFFLPDTPNSMLERGKYEEAKQMLKKVRGTENVDHEF
ncbi:unnamed protein product [Brassica rapa]|uniref:Major facilitator superfamily (MFS) profile domain-containing protein n=2 Tax=Brassica TaxID=3705 RepID=A0A8D9H0P4_BRACM|nr:unnamed protein product [Brassica napus]CAG7889749.1 unnamed protein product [Brassica rapa]